MGQKSSLTPRSKAAQIDPALAAKIVDIEDRDGPRAAYVVLNTRLKTLESEGQPVPAELISLQDRLAAECCSLSQGR